MYTEACTVVRKDAGLSESWFASRVSTESIGVVYVGKDCRQTLFSAQYVYKNDSQAVQWCAWLTYRG